MDTLRVPFLIVAIVLIALVVMVEAGSAAFLSSEAPPGYGIPFMAFVDGLILFTAGLMGLSMILQKGIHAKLQGILTLVVSFLLLLAIIVLVFLALTLLMLMVSLLLAPLFGTIAYFAVFADFNRSGAQVILSLLMLLKMGYAICLFLAHPRFIQNKGLVLIVLTSLLAQIITSFLHGLPPRFLVSITDMIAAIISAILAAIWCLFLLVGSIGSVIKALRVDKDVA